MSLLDNDEPNEHRVCSKPSSQAPASSTEAPVGSRPVSEAPAGSRPFSEAPASLTGESQPTSPLGSTPLPCQSHPRSLSFNTSGPGGNIR